MAAKQDLLLMQVQLLQPPISGVPFTAERAGRGVGKDNDRGAMVVSVSEPSGQSTRSRPVSVKRKLEELEIGVAESSASTAWQVRLRRESGKGLRGIIGAGATGRECYEGDLVHSEQAGAVDGGSQVKGEDGNAARDMDAMCGNQADWNRLFEGIFVSIPDRFAEKMQQDVIVKASEGCPLDMTVTVAPQMGNMIDNSKSIADTNSVSICENVSVAGTGTSDLGGGESSGRSGTGSECGLVSGDEVVVGEMESMKSVEQDEKVNYGTFISNSVFLEGNPHCNIGASVCSTIAAGPFCNGGNSNTEAYANSTPGHAHPKLQFFVRTYIDGRTIVLHANGMDTIESVLKQILLRTGLPIAEQRLIYFGRQLQYDQTLAECRVCNDATLYLVARMKSTALPQSWQLVNELVSTIRQICAMGYQERHARNKLVEAQESIRSGVKEFLRMAAEAVPVSEHLQVFRLAGATSALVMLLLSPIETNRECAEESIKLFLCAPPDEVHICCHRAPLLLDFCKLLAKCAPGHALYFVCRNALAYLLDTIGVVYERSYFYEAKAESIVHDFAPFVNELSLRLSAILEGTA